jgi:3'(2'), 5'-bisphosphate nucleotidase
MDGTPLERHALAREVAVAERLAREAGKLVLQFHGAELEVERKAGDEPVTIADRQASELIVGGLVDAFPDDIVISEENADDLRRLGARRVWYIDPIDGTKDFIRGEDGFCVMIGLCLDHRPAVGVIYQPVHDRLFSAAPGGGTWLAAPGVAPVQAHASAIAELHEVRLVASKSHRGSSIDRVKSALGISNELNIGSVGLKLGTIALGERDLYVNPSSKTSSWDTCGPEALLVEAGGRVSDIEGTPLRYDTENIHHRRGLVASNGPIHDAVIAKLAPLFAGHMPG